VVELRRYMGPKGAQIPRGTIVKLVKKSCGKGIVEYNGKLYACPLRILWRIRERGGGGIRKSFGGEVSKKVDSQGL